MHRTYPTLLILYVYGVPVQGEGLGLVLSGGMLLEDTERILLSRLILTDLPQPLFYYAALLLMCLGLVLTALAVLGCWSAHLNNYCLLSLVSTKHYTGSQILQTSLCTFWVVYSTFSHG